jgi:hypothetical protein
MHRPKSVTFHTDGQALITTSSGIVRRWRLPDVQ